MSKTFKFDESHLNLNSFSSMIKSITFINWEFELSVEICVKIISKRFSSLRLLHIVHVNQKSHMISIYLIIVIEWNQCSSKLRKWQKSIHFHNDFDQNFHDYISNDAFLKIQFFALFATIQCDFDHISMRIRSIFHIVNDLNEIHFELYNKFLFVKFIYWMQLLKRCEIVEIANSLRNVEFRNFIKCKSNSE